MDFSSFLLTPDDFTRVILPIGAIWEHKYFRIKSSSSLNNSYQVYFDLKLIEVSFQATQEQLKTLEEFQKIIFTSGFQAKQTVLKYLQSMTQYDLPTSTKRSTPASVFFTPKHYVGKQNFLSHRLCVHGKSGYWMPSSKSHLLLSEDGGAYKTAKDMLKAVHAKIIKDLPVFYFNHYQDDQKLNIKIEGRVDHPDYLWMLFIKPDADLVEVFS